jgi:membrane protease YdiL (CAAX protease family)
MSIRTLSAREFQVLLGSGALAGIVAAVTAVTAPALALDLSPRAVLVAKALLVAPIIEEAFFRSVVQSTLRSLRGPFIKPWVSIGLTAVLFGLVHLPSASVGHALSVMAPAIVIGWIYERTRSLGICIAVHGMANAVWLGFWSL